jgi:CheY-like chemotaxis protein
MSVAGATVLVVDDEPAVLETVRDGLAAHGYQVLTATGPDEAVQVAQAHTGTIALALIDVVMPGMSGPQVAQRLHETRPDLKVLFMVHGLTAATLCSSNRSAWPRSAGRFASFSNTVRRSHARRSLRAE